MDQIVGLVMFDSSCSVDDIYISVQLLDKLVELIEFQRQCSYSCFLLIFLAFGGLAFLRRRFRPGRTPESSRLEPQRAVGGALPVVSYVIKIGDRSAATLSKGIHICEKDQNV